MSTRRRHKPPDFSAEIEAHIGLEADRLRSEGLSDVDARVQARRAFGNPLLAQERYYESRHSPGGTPYAGTCCMRSALFAAVVLLQPRRRSHWHVADGGKESWSPPIFWTSAIRWEASQIWRLIVKVRSILRDATSHSASAEQS